MYCLQGAIIAITEFNASSKVRDSSLYFMTSVVVHKKVGKFHGSLVYFSLYSMFMQKYNKDKKIIVSYIR